MSKEPWEAQWPSGINVSCDSAREVGCEELIVEKGGAGESCTKVNCQGTYKARGSVT